MSKIRKGKANGWKIFGIGLVSVLLLGGLCFGGYKLVQHYQDAPPADTEQTEQENQTPETETTPEEEVAAAAIAGLEG